MEQGNSYNYAYAQRQRSPSVSSSRHSNAYQNSSAFSASANPDEDWTQISDLAERRRIQNRIAQRNYRKKLKRRLEDLEKRTTSSSVSPEQAPREIIQVSSKPTSLHTNGHVQRSKSHTSATSQGTQCITDAFDAEHGWSSSRSTTTPSFTFASSAPPTYSYSDVPHSDYFNNVNYASSQCQPVPSLYTGSSYQQPYAQTMSPIPPSMPAYEDFRTGTNFPPRELMTSFDLNYASLAGVNLGMSQQNSTEYELRTPPLTDAPSCIGSSRGCSPIYFGRSITPNSRSVSPITTFL